MMTQRLRLTDTASRIALTLVATGLASASAIGAATSHAPDLICRANYDYCVEVDGKYPQDARFFQSDSRGKFVVQMPSNNDGVLIDLASKKVTNLPPELVTRDAAPGVMRVKNSIPAGSPSSDLVVDGPVLRFQTGSVKVRVLKVLDRPPVIGPVELNDLINDRMEYREAMRLYEPDKASLDSLKQSRKPVEIEAYFATWCGHCKIYMPRLLRVLQDGANPKIKVNLVGVPKNFGNVEGPWKAKSLQNIPTIIVHADGREITRLGTHEGARPEIELAGIISALK